MSIYIYNKNKNTHLNYLMIVMPGLSAIETEWLVCAIEAVHVAFVSGRVDVGFAHREECGRQ